MRLAKILIPAVTVVFLVLVNVAYAQAAPTGTGDQVGTLIDLLMTGKYIPAVGVLLIAFVALARSAGGILVPWFRTRVGGLVLSYGSSILLYVGAALQAGRLSLGVLVTAIGAGWAAAGGFEHLKDLVAALRPPAPQIPVAKVALRGVDGSLVVGVILSCAVAGVLVTQACSGSKSPGAAVIDCTGGNAPGIVTNVLATLEQWNKPEPDGCRTATGWNWGCVEHAAIAKGEQIGGCAIAELVNSFLQAQGPKATPVAEGWRAREALEQARAHWGGNVVWRTAKGEL